MKWRLWKIHLFHPGGLRQEWAEARKPVFRRVTDFSHQGEKSGEGEFWIDEGKVESTEFIFGRNQSENGSEAERRPELAPSSLLGSRVYCKKPQSSFVFQRRT